MHSVLDMCNVVFRMSHMSIAPTVKRECLDKSLPKQHAIGEVPGHPVAECSPLQLVNSLHLPFLLSTEHSGPVPCDGHGRPST